MVDVLKLVFLLTFIIIMPMFARTDGKISSKIVGGTTAKPGEFPYQVALLKSDGSLSCSGSIISTRWILTAGHCLVKYNISDITVRIGSNDFTSGGITYAPKKFVIHENYTELTEHDIALIKLNRSIDFTNGNTSVSLVLLTMSDTLPKTKVIFSGWGRTALNEPDSNKLLKINLVTTSAQFCKKKLGEHPDHSQPGPNNICTFTKSGEGVCKGDSGGPLVNKFTQKQVGIASFAIDCAAGVPDVFTDVFKYRDWIFKNKIWS